MTDAHSSPLAAAVARDDRDAASQARIRAMVGYLRERLRAIGDQGDCAYERAMGTKYRELLVELEARLESSRGYA